MIALISLIFGLWVVFLNIKNDYFGIIEKLVMFFLGMLLTLLVTMLICFISTAIFPLQEAKIVNCQMPIYSFNVLGINTNLLVGACNVKSQPYYYVFTKDSRGGYRQVQLKSENCIIFQKDDVAPQVLWQQMTKRPSKWVYIGPNLFDNIVDTQYDIYVPNINIVEKPLTN